MVVRLLVFAALCCAAAAIASGCDDDADSVPTPDAGSPAPPGAVQGRLFDAMTLAPLAGATVKVPTPDGVVTGMTDAEGKFMLAGLAPLDQATVRIDAEGHEAAIKLAPVRSDATTYLELTAMPKAAELPLYAATGGVAKLDSGVSVKLPPGAVVDADGATATGKLDMRMTAVQPLDPRQLAALPPVATAKHTDGTPALLVPVAGLSCNLSQGGASMDLAAGQDATMKVSAGRRATAKQASSFSWSASAQAWVEEGAFLKVGPARGGTWETTVKHFSYWLAAVPAAATSCVRGCVDGAADGAVARVVVTGVDQPFRQETSVDASGCFAVDVVGAARLRVRAYDGSAVTDGAMVTTGTTGSADDPSTCADLGTLSAKPVTGADAACPRGMVACGGACVDLDTDPLHCGSCDTSCDVVSMPGADAGLACVEGTCACPASAPDTCDGACVDTQTDPAHCGSCGMACGAGDECVGGTCQPLSCAPGLTVVGDACVDTLSDPAHCGDPGTGDYQTCLAPVLNFPYASTNRASCVDGVCGCLPGEIQCNGVCANPETTPWACGDCMTQCPSGQTCEGGQCVPLDCGSTQTVCANDCLDPSDPPCSACAPGCGAGQVCNGAACVCDTAGGYEDCNPDPTILECVLTQGADSANCGACGNPCTFGFCTYGSCVMTLMCASPTTNCGGPRGVDCIDLTVDDPDNCGGCGVSCGDTATCMSGTCQCNGGLTRCDPAPAPCIDLTSDPSHCGSCAVACPTGASCVDGVCAF